MNRQRGSILLISLSLVGVLAVMAVALARSLTLEVRLTRLRLARAEAQAMARSGIYLAMQKLTQDGGAAEADGKVYDWNGDDWGFPAGLAVPSEAAAETRFAGTVHVSVTDEAGKLPVNTAGVEPLGRLLDDPALAQAIVDMIDPADPEENRPDDEPPYFAKNGPIDALEELTGVDGMTPEGYHVLMAHATPYVVTPEPVNLNTASEEVLRAMGVSERAIQIIQTYRTGPDGDDAHAEDGVFAEGGLMILQTLEDKAGTDLGGTEDGNLLSSTQFGVQSNVFLVTAEGVIERPAVRAKVSAVVRRAGCPGARPAPCIVAWREG